MDLNLSKMIHFGNKMITYSKDDIKRLKKFQRIAKKLVPFEAKITVKLKFKYSWFDIIKTM